MRRTILVAMAVIVAAVVVWPRPVAAQTPFFPYFGKNQIRYDNFRWQIYTTDHFEIYYYPEIEQHLERVAGYAESAYQHISSELKYDLAFKIQLILFKTSAEFQQQNVIPGAAQEGVGAFAEPTRYRIVMPLDDPPDLLYRLIVHELTHQFEFDIIPTSLIRRNIPLWVNEGLSDYMTGIWRPIDLMTVRDAAVADIVPKMSELEGYTNVGSVRMIYNLGHAVFEFIESRWGKEGIRQFLFSLRKSVIGGGEDAYMEALRLSPEEFDQEFDKYLKDRFKPFRDKERPADYGRNLAPNPEKGVFIGAASIEPSPSGDLIAMVTGNRRDREMDIVLVSSRDGSVIRNLTSEFDQDKGWEFIIQPGMRFNTVPWLSWAPTGDRLAYFVRREKWRTLILQNVITTEIEQRLEMREVDDPESPDISPDGTKVAFAALQGGVGDIWVIDLQSRQLTNVTKDNFADSGPTWSPDGQSIIYVARVSGNEKLFRLDVATGQKTQLTFGTHDDSAAQFLDADTLVFSSTATDPGKPIEADVARNGNVYNIWTLGLKAGELRQYTDTLGGNTSAVVLRAGRAEPRIAFVSYYKGEWELHTLDRRDPIAMAATADFGAPGPIIDFQAPLSHTLIAENKRRKGAFEKLFLDGRPPVNVGVTSSGDVFGGSAVTFSDVLGDKQISLYAASISQYRTLAFSFFNAARRFNYSLQGFSQTQFFYGALEGVFYDPAISSLIDRDLAVATRTVRGGTAFGIWPLDRYRRVELFGGVMQYREEFNDPTLQAISAGLPAATVRTRALQKRHLHPAWRQLRSGDDRVPGVRSACGQHDAPLLRGLAEHRRHARPADRRRRCSLLPPPGRHRTARAAREGVQELGRRSRFHVLRRQFGDARVRIPAVHRLRGWIPECRAALSVHRSDADAGRRARRHPRGALCEHGRRRGSRDSRISGSPRARTSTRPWWITPFRRSATRRRCSEPRSASTGSGWWTLERRTASGSRHSPSASPSTSTGHGERSSTSLGRICSSRRAAAAPRSANRNSRCGSDTTSRRASRVAETQS